MCKISDNRNGCSDNEYGNVPDEGDIGKHS